MDDIQAIIGEDRTFLGMLEHVSQLAPMDKACLVIGERGSGKELIAARLHYLSKRWQGPLVQVNCATLTESLLESELFGHEAGAFTGAQARHVGRFERADGGTLVLDEIATAAAATQEKILRVIEYGEIERVGGSEVIKLDVRVVGVTNVDLPALASAGKFRADLLDRLAFDVVTVPPLRARPVDIPLLAHAFALDMTRELGRELFAGFSPEAERALLAHSWPGNVRELKNVIERSVYRMKPVDAPLSEIAFDPFASPWRPGARVEGTPGDTPAPAGEPEVTDFTAAVAEFERNLLSRAMTANRHNQTEAAQSLGLGYHQFRRLIKKRGIG